MLGSILPATLMLPFGAWCLVPGAWHSAERSSRLRGHVGIPGAALTNTHDENIGDHPRAPICGRRGPPEGTRLWQEPGTPTETYKDSKNPKLLKKLHF